MASSKFKKTTGRSKSGQAGGKATAERHGRDFYSRIGRMGGQARGRRIK
jgi:general stress protein YciG